MKKTFTIILLINIKLIFAQEYCVTAQSGLIIRKKPTINSERLGKYEKYKIIDIVDKTKIKFKTKTTKGFWYKVKFKGKYAYVYSGFLKPLEEILPQKIALNFYKWYLKEFYGQGGLDCSPRISQNENNKTFFLDLEKFKESLKSTRYFSSLYFNNNFKEYHNCEKELAKIDYEEVNECGCNPAEFTGKECNFSFYYVWTNGQGERLNNAKIKDFTVNENTAEIKISIGNIENDNTYEYSISKVSMNKENGKWKISQINVGWE